MPEYHLIAAIGTPLTSKDALDASALAKQLGRIWRNGIHGVFVAGTMGVGPLLTDRTWQDLIVAAAHLVRGRGELMIGASDLSLARTRERIDWLNRFEIDGVVVLPPFFMRFGQDELIAYYRALADSSRSPVYLYDLPQRTHTTIESDTVLTLAGHPNIAGIKCSGNLEDAQALMRTLEAQGMAFRVITAQPDRLHELVTTNMTEHLDGMYALAPRWSQDIIDHTIHGRADIAQKLQADLVLLRETMRRYGGLPALTVLMNAAGVPGCFAPRPFCSLPSAHRQRLLAEPVVNRFLKADRASRGTPEFQTPRIAKTLRASGAAVSSRNVQPQI